MVALVSVVSRQSVGHHSDLSNSACVRRAPDRLAVVSRFSAGFQVNALCVYPGLRMKSMVSKILFIIDNLVYREICVSKAVILAFIVSQFPFCQASKVICYLLSSRKRARL